MNLEIFMIANINDFYAFHINIRARLYPYKVFHSQQLTVNNYTYKKLIGMGVCVC